MKKLPVLFIFLLLTPSLCHAYVGPGMGFTVITSLLALGSAFFITVFGFIWLPIKHFFKGTDDDSKDNTEDSDAENKQNQDEPEKDPQDSKK